MEFPARREIYLINLKCENNYGLVELSYEPAVCIIKNLVNKMFKKHIVKAIWYVIFHVLG